MRKLFCLLFLCLSITSQAQALKFRKNGEFKIVQFTDIHYNGSRQSQVALSVVDSVLQHERPDLVVLTGDSSRKLPSQHSWAPQGKARCQCNPLAFTARKLTRATVCKFPRIVKPCGLHAAFKYLPHACRLVWRMDWRMAYTRVAKLQPKQHVIENTHVQQVGVLQQQGCLLAPFCRPGKVQYACGGALQKGQQAQQG